VLGSVGKSLPTTRELSIESDYDGLQAERPLEHTDVLRSRRDDNHHEIDHGKHAAANELNPRASLRLSPQERNQTRRN
jgi:hypothetical protein